MPAISIVIPLYNKALSVKRAIDSVLAQQFGDFELIVVDDGSTDNSYQQAAQFSDPRIRLLRQQNQGVSVARNNGVAAASCQYVAFLDADDCYHTDFLQRIISLIQHAPDAALYCCRFQLVDEQGNTFVPSGSLNAGFYGDLPQFFRTFKQNRSLLHPSSMAVNKASFITAGGFPAGKAVGEDLELIIKLALSGKVMTDYQVACTVFRNAENRTAKRYPAEASCHIQYFLQQTDWKRGLSPFNIAEVTQFLLHNTLLHIAGALLNGQRKLARYYTALLWRHSWRYGLYGCLLMLLPQALLAYIKRRRNHG